MTRKKTNSGPSMFAEWVIGTSLQPYITKPKSKPRKRRDVIRVEVTTDDESEADILTITYPRLHTLSDKEKESETAKKVRFEEKPKSALKQADKQEATSDNDKSASDATTETEPATESESEIEESKKKKTKSKGNNKKTDAEPHPDCKCSKCVSGREKQKNEKQEKEKKPEAESKKSTQKGKEAKVESDTDVDTSEPEKSNENATKKKDESKNGTKKKEDNTTTDSAKDEKKPEKAKKDKKTEKAADAPKDDKQQKKYPEAYPFYHPRLPNLIGPIRAQVVQTEPVVETAEDPPPNAFYDAQHNIMRVYHGPVYGNHFSRSLYPMRDANGRPLPIGMPHPTQNPYLYGFKNPGGVENAPAWPPTMGYPPSNQLPQQQPPPPAPPPQHQQQQPAAVLSPTGSKGAFSKQSPGRVDDLSGQNNVGPEPQNPYYATKRTKSVFSDMASNSPQSRVNSQNGSTSNGNGGNQPAWDNNLPQTDTQTQDTWPNTNTSPDQNAQWNEPANPSNWDNNNSGNNDHNWGGGGQDAYNGNNNDNNGGGGNWDNGDATNATATWDNAQPNTQDMPSQPSQRESGQATNVGPIPGSWNEAAQNNAAPGWQDPSMAATTHGKIDAW